MRRPVRRDLQLSEYGHARLDEIVEHARRQELLGEAGDLNVTTLFLGPSGTGKTLAAEVLADELGLELYRVDLSKIVSKYIGETEKHLSRIFDAAEPAGAVLFFDEADALFGRRTGVNSSHDRYANSEIAYLLSRIEQYNGLAILATNSKSNIDPAFLRRIRFVVDFPPPR
jgi:SpoVK/Ycf46/Vps4 family AAA+-type ATPase